MTRHGAEPLRSGTPEHAALEAELRDWMGRRADAVTAETLRTRDVPLPAGTVRGRRVPLRLALPVAALAVVAAGWAVLGSTAGSDAPLPVRVPPAAPAPQTDAPTPNTSPPAPLATAPSSASVAPVNPSAATVPPSVPPPDTPPDTPRTPSTDNPRRTSPPAAGDGRRIG
ncbi:hypothetical protein ACFZBU_14260 [Embleya sp. NPDC008237]|uniref:hypothetical protein n=1 Tax=Embleya sp. NPDC008237 TaxID=3363978 RepID=UPI0036E40665